MAGGGEIGHQHLAALRGRRLNGRKQAAGAAVHQQPGTPAAIQAGRSLHRLGQHTIRIVQVIKAVNLGDVQRFRNGAAQCAGPPFVARHMEGIRRPRRVVGQPPGQRAIRFLLRRLP